MTATTDAELAAQHSHAALLLDGPRPAAHLRAAQPRGELQRSGASGLCGADAAYGFSYSGLYLLQRSGDAYFLVTDDWNTDDARLVVLPDTASIRVEFRP